MESITEACKMNNCSLGGETAEMPGYIKIKILILRDFVLGQ